MLSISKPRYAGPNSQHIRLIHPKSHTLRRILLSATKLFIPLILLAAALGYLTFATVTYNSVEEIPKIKTLLVNETLPAEISFEDYHDNVYEYGGKVAILNGSLKEYIMGDETAGVHAFGIVDDYNNTIELISVPSELKSLFPKRGITGELYSVTGVFSRKYKTLQFKPTSITPYKRELAKQIEKRVPFYYTENITRTVIKSKYPTVRNFVFNLVGKPISCDDQTLLGNCSEIRPFYCTYSGLVKNPTKCGCSQGERLFNDGCILEVKCDDGTLDPECSNNKPKQCVSGILTDNANLCGCPEDYLKTGNSCKKILRCLDGTVYGECSKNKPLYCDGGQLIERASECGCKYSYVAKSDYCIFKDKAEAQDAFDYVNGIRSSYGRSKLVWDDRLYDLAVFRSRDMYERRYFDHVTPEGKCVKDYKAQFNLSGYTLAENGGAVINSGSSDTYVSYADYNDPKKQADNWMGSRGHKYNLLYSSHVIGAIGCYRGACIFLGGNTDPYGFGFGPCTTGDEGLAFWETANKQKGEI